MGAARFAKAMAAIVLFNGALFLCARAEVLAGEREDEAKRYAQQLRTAKDTKTKVKALTELGALAQIKKGLIAEALPDVYKATEDKEPGVRAAAAEALGKAAEPYSKAGAVLVKMLKDEKNDSVKIGALNGLAVMREEAKEALPAIREVQKSVADDKKSKVGIAAKAAITAIGGGKGKKQ